MAVIANNDTLKTSSAEQPVPPKKTPAKRRTKSKRARQLQAGAVSPEDGHAHGGAKQVDVTDVASTGSVTDNAADSAKTASAPERGKRAPRRRAKKTRRPAVSDAGDSVDATTAGDSAPNADAAGSETADSPATEEPQRKRRPSKRKTATKSDSAHPDDASHPEDSAPPTANDRSSATPGTRGQTDNAADGGDAGPRSQESDGGRTRSRKRPQKRRTRDEDRAADAATEPAGAEETEGKDAAAKDARNRRETEPARRGKRPRRNTSESSRAAREAKQNALADTITEIGPGDAPPENDAKPGHRLMLVNVSADDECRIAVLHENRLEELFIERSSAQSHVGNIYKGRVTNVEPSIQAVFVDFGLARNGFLHISDVQPQYFPDHKGELEEVGRKIPRHARPPIQRCFRRGQEVIVQVIKEGVGTKGPTLTTYLSIPGRFLVMMPGMSRLGVTRRIEDEDVRRQARTLLGELELPTDMGFILRTAGVGRPKRDLQRDLNYLLRMWKSVVSRVKHSGSPAEVYQESDLVTRTIRDVYTSDFGRMVVDDAETAKKARDFLQIAMPRSKAVVEVYSEMEPLFHRWGIEEEIERMNSRHVPLPSGGSLVIDSTEALVAIDVNSGKFRANDDAEETAYQTNMEAAAEIAHQLRLRDLGGLIVCDFIDMRADRHQRAVERVLRDGLKKHKERAKILRMSAFGLIEMTRQRQGPSIRRNIYFECRHCSGAGLVKMPESVILDVMRMTHLAVHHDKVRHVTITVSTDVAYEILNRKRAALMQIEDETGKTIIVQGDASFRSDQIECVCEDAQGRPVQLATGRQEGPRDHKR